MMKRYTLQQLKCNIIHGFGTELPSLIFSTDKEVSRLT